MNMLRKTLKILNKKERKHALILFIMSSIMALLEMVGVASVLPFMYVLSNPDILQENNYFRQACEFVNCTDTQQFLIFLGGAVFIFLVLSNAFKALTAYATLKFSFDLNHNIASRLMETYLGRSYVWFLQRSSSDLSKVMLSEVNQVTSKAIMPIIQICTQSILVCVLLALLLLVDFKLALSVFVVLGTCYGLIFLLIRKKLKILGAQRMASNKIRFQTTQEALGGIKDVRVRNAEHIFLNRFIKASRSYTDAEVTNQTFALMPRYVLETIGFGGILTLTLYLLATREGLSDILPLLTLYAMAGYRLLPALQQIYQNLSNLSFSEQVLTALEEDFEALDDDCNITPDRTARLPLEKTITLENISFAYSQDGRYALQDLSFAIKHKTTVGFVGATGAGKTTVLDLILGLIQTEQGEIIIDDKPLVKNNIRAWQNNLGYVPQFIFLSNNSITHNIAFGVDEDEIDIEAVTRAAKIANLHDFINEELPEGYNTVVGERGVRLSGGQRQRIGIARALYHDPDVLLFDEATSALDNITEQLVMEAIQNISGQKTIILIAHRLSTVEKCDMIYLLDHGKLKAQGTYKELLKTSPMFKSLAQQEHN